MQDGCSSSSLYFLRNIDRRDSHYRKRHKSLLISYWLQLVICLSLNQITVAREYNVLIGLDLELHSNSVDGLQGMSEWNPQTETGAIPRRSEIVAGEQTKHVEEIILEVSMIL